jgi:hypothetical protein
MTVLGMAGKVENNFPHNFHRLSFIMAMMTPLSHHITSCLQLSKKFSTQFQCGESKKVVIKHFYLHFNSLEFVQLESL